MSAFGSKADIRRRRLNVCFDPKRTCARSVSLGSRIETVGCAVALTVAVDRHVLKLGAVRLNARRCIDFIFASSRRSFKSRIFLNCESSMENIALNDSGAI